MFCSLVSYAVPACMVTVAIDRAAIEQWFDSMYRASPVDADALSRQLQEL